MPQREPDTRRKEPLHILGAGVLLGCFDKDRFTRPDVNTDVKYREADGLLSQISPEDQSAAASRKDRLWRRLDRERCFEPESETGKTGERGAFHLPPGPAGGLSAKTPAVSYTHLDVYKRQRRKSTRWAWRRTRHRWITRWGTTSKSPPARWRASSAWWKRRCV